MRRPTSVAVLMFDGAALFETSVPLSVFGIDRTSTGAPPFRTLAVAAERGRLTSTAGVRLDAPHGLDALESADVVVVPTWRDPAEPPPRPAVEALHAAHERGALVVGLCLGAFVVAAAGLLDGRRAATHWLHAPALAAAFPKITVDPAVLYVDEGSVITSAGTAAGLDACLHVVRRLHGAGAAAAIARRMVVSPQRAGGQAQFIESASSDLGRHELAEVLEWVVGHLYEAIEVDALAEMASMSRRTFDRRFKEVTGTSPLQWILHQRILQAQRLLETTDLPIDHVARRVGFATGVTLRPHFRRTVGLSPQAYRHAFHTPA